jgi:exopolysaccharide biosynthesis polyprenyl glycosylphosphotransferase
MNEVSAPDWELEFKARRHAGLTHALFKIAGLILVQNLFTILLTRFFIESDFLSGPHPLLIELLPILVLASFASILAFYLARQLVQFPGSTIIIYFPVCLILNFLVMAFVVVVLRLDYSRVAIVGSLIGGLIWVILDYLMFGVRTIVRIAAVPGGKLRDITEIPNLKVEVLKKPSDHTHQIDMVVADLHHDHPAVWEAYLAKCALASIPVFDVKALIERFTGRVEIEHLSENSFGAALPSMFYLQVKYIIDIVLALCVLPFVLIVLLLAAIFIKLETPGPVMFVQKRAGYRGREFAMYKLRSMRVQGNRGPSFTVKNDDRITRVGAVIRRYRIDELPQILNILRGEMSWIGPRPEPTDVYKRYAQEIPYYIYRHVVRPGITGWAQVTQGYAAELGEATRKLHYDFYYIKNFSAYLDLMITLRTVYTLTSGFGSR